MGLVVDEYGEIQGLVTLQDISRKLSANSPASRDDTGLYRKQDDGSVIVEGSCPLRVLNRKLGFNFPLDGPRPSMGFCSSTWKIFRAGRGLKNRDYPIEILQVQDTMVKIVRLTPPKSLA